MIFEIFLNQEVNLTSILNILPGLRDAGILHKIRQFLNLLCNGCVDRPFKNSKAPEYQRLFVFVCGADETKNSLIYNKTLLSLCLRSRLPALLSLSQIFLLSKLFVQIYRLYLDGVTPKYSLKLFVK